MADLHMGSTGIYNNICYMGLAARVWGTLLPTEHSMGELIPSFGGILDMPVIYWLSIYVL